MSSGALRAAWEAAQKEAPATKAPGDALRAAWEEAQRRSRVEPEVSDESTMGYGERFATTLAQAAQVIPGMKNLEAGAAAVGSHLPKKLGGTGAPVTYREAFEGLNEQTEGMGKGRKFLAEAAASPVLAPVMGLRAIKALSLPVQGAALGATSGAATGLDPDATLASTAINTVTGGIAGLLGGTAVKGAGNLATKTGLTDAVASTARRLGGRAAQVGEAIGTKGAANKVLQGRQDILDRLSGSEKSAAQTMLDHVEHYRAQAKDLYDVARQDQRILSDPAVVEAISDPHVQQLLEVQRARLGTGAAPEPPPQSAGGIFHGSPRTDLTRISANPETRQFDNATSQLGAFFSAGKQEAQRYAGTAGRVYEVPSPLNNPYEMSWGEFGKFQDPTKGAGGKSVQFTEEGLAARTEELKAEAAALRSKLEAAGHDGIVVRNTKGEPVEIASFRDVPVPAAAPQGGAALPSPEELHLTKQMLQNIISGRFQGDSPIGVAEAVQLQPKLEAVREALHAASPAWKHADNFYAQAKTFEDAFTKAYGAQQNPTASALNPKKLKSTASIQAWAEKPAETTRQIARRSGVQAGTAGRITKEVANQPVGSNVADVLNAPSLKSSPSAAALRRPAFADDQASQAFADLLGKTAGEGAKDASRPSSIGIGKYSITRSAKPNLLEKPAGVELRAKLAEQLADPKRAPQIRAALMQSKEGRAMLELITKSGVGAVGSASPHAAMSQSDRAIRALGLRASPP